MLPKPDTEQHGWRTLPWACLAFFLAYLTIFLVYQRDESQKQLELAQWYQQSGLFELEWENYISWLRISGQVAKAEELEAAKQDKDTLTVFRAMAFDPSFERENRLRGDQYWNVDQRIAWENTREQFRQRADSLPSVRFGLNPQAPRPSTYLTWHFLHDSWVQWLVALLAVLWVPLILFQFSVLTRVVGGLINSFDVKKWGAMLYAIVLALFLLFVVITVIRGLRAKQTRPITA